MKKYKIEVDESQLELISKVLDFYSRIGILQFEELLEHPTIQKLMEEKNKVELKKGSITNKGEVVEIGCNSIKVRTDDNEIKDYGSNDLSVINYVKFHNQKNSLFNQLTKIKSVLTSGEIVEGSYGVYSDEIDDSCKISYDLYQQLRHQIWLDDTNRNSYSVDSRVYLCDINNKIKIDKIDG